MSYSVPGTYCCYCEKDLSSVEHVGLLSVHRNKTRGRIETQDEIPLSIDGETYVKYDSEIPYYIYFCDLNCLTNWCNKNEEN